MSKEQKNPFAYAGRIGNAGSQKVEAPFAQKPTAKGTVQKGEDLRHK